MCLRRENVIADFRLGDGALVDIGSNISRGAVALSGEPSTLFTLAEGSPGFTIHKEGGRTAGATIAIME